MSHEVSHFNYQASDRLRIHQTSVPDLSSNRCHHKNAKNVLSLGKHGDGGGVDVVHHLLL